MASYACSKQCKKTEHKNDLTGVPKYFYDLYDALNTKSKNKSDETITKLVGKIKKIIAGEFVFESGGLSFVDENNRVIDKNLVSFGMTSLGMLGLLLKNNLIGKGSFVFFDEPETNLHPQWQVLLIDVFIELAKNGINIVMATHSLDMIKALEVKTKNEKDDFVGVNHFKSDGKLMKFESKNTYENLQKSREILSEAYEDLYYENSIND
ncbi:MAG: hypothetical protein DRQ51_05580 [Gammaproteobacteria bacterium]|nr:MAG: hypothetical protein DRQ51_05580 [Gammaproteobacteria bacterium]